MNQIEVKEAIESFGICRNCFKSFDCEEELNGKYLKETRYSFEKILNCASMSLIREERKLKEEEKRKREDKTDDTVPVLGQVGINMVEVDTVKVKVDKVKVKLDKVEVKVDKAKQR